MRVSKLCATTVAWSTAHPWHFGARIPLIGPAVGVDVLAGRAPFGFDPFEWVVAGIAQNPNVVVCGAPANGKSAFVKQALWWSVGAFGCRFVATDAKGEYTMLAAALGVPVLDLRPGGPVHVNPLDDELGRLEFVTALAALCLDRSLGAVERAALTAAVRLLPDRPMLRDLLGVLRDAPETICAELAIERVALLDDSRELRLALGELLHGRYAGMFDAPTDVDLAGSPRGFVIDVSGCGTDDVALRLAMLAGTRAADQLVGAAPGRTIVVNDEAWRLTGNRDTVRWLQHSFKLGRQVAVANVLVVHRFAELGAQADGSVGQIAGRLVSDADTRVMFRHGDLADAQDTVERLGLPAAVAELLATMAPHRCLVQVRDRLALVDVVLSERMRSLADTDVAMRATGWAPPAVPG